MSILVFTVTRQGRIPKTFYEALTFAGHLAKPTDAEVVGLVCGEVANEELSHAGKYGSHGLYHYSGLLPDYADVAFYSDLIHEFSGQHKVTTYVFGANGLHQSLAPYLAARLDIAYAGGITGLPVGDTPLVLRRYSFSGKVLSDVVIGDERCVIQLSANSIPAEVSEALTTPEPWQGSGSFRKSDVAITGRKSPEGKQLLSDAEIIVSGGRGMKGPEHWKHLEDLAEILGAATACSRPVSDEGWRPHHEHVGQTGKVVAPNLYIACGISGAIQHLAGISSSKVIVAINKDPEAPIFSAANYGIIGDVHKVLPVLVEAVRRLKT